MTRRCVPYEFLEEVLRQPEQILHEGGGKKIFQSQLEFPGGKIHLLRVVVAEDRDPPVVVTVYRTSKIAKYWRPE